MTLKENWIPLVGVVMVEDVVVGDIFVLGLPVNEMMKKKDTTKTVSNLL